MFLNIFNGDILKADDLDFTESELNNDLANSSIFLDQLINKEFKITSMTLPWLFKYEIGTKNDYFFRKMFFKIFLKLINYYYYLQSAKEFSVVLSTILPKINEIKNFRKTFFNYDKSDNEQIIEHIFYRVSELEVYILNTEKFSNLEELSKENYQYSSLQKV